MIMVVCVAERGEATRKVLSARPVVTGVFEVVTRVFETPIVSGNIYLIELLYS